MCRCGSERKRLEALGYQFNSEPSAAARPAARHRVTQDYGLAGTLLGYQLDTDLSTPIRVMLKAFFGLAVIGVVAVLVLFTHTEPLPTRENIQVLNTLDGFTRAAGPDSANTIPMFLASAGRLGVLAATGTDTDPVKSIPESDLNQGFCTQSVVRQVRHEYPGFYDHWPDDKLEKTVLEKYPEYADRVCVLSVRFDATASRRHQVRIEAAVAARPRTPLAANAASCGRVRRALPERVLPADRRAPCGAPRAGGLTRPA